MQNLISEKINSQIQKKTSYNVQVLVEGKVLNVVFWNEFIDPIVTNIFGAILEEFK